MSTFAHANTVVIDFQQLELVNGNVNLVGAPYLEGGFQIALSTSGSGSATLANLGTLRGDYAGSTAMVANETGTVTSTLTLTREDGGTFDALSIDLAHWIANSTVQTVDFTGDLLGGGTVSLVSPFSLSTGAFALQTFNFPANFQNLVSLSWEIQGGGAGHRAQWDNITLSANAVPETSAWALIVAAMLPFAWGLTILKTRRRH